MQISVHPWRDSWEGQPGGDWAAEVSLGWPLWSSLPRARANSWTSGTWEQKPLLTILAQFQGVEIFPTLPNQEAAIFTSMVGHGRACLIMANLSKPNGHSSHPVGNKLPQVKYYEVLGEFYELWGSPSINWSQPWKNNVMWTVESACHHYQSKETAGAEETRARLSTLLVISGTEDTLTSHIFVPLRIKMIKSLLFLSLYLVQYICAYNYPWNIFEDMGYIL